MRRPGVLVTIATAWVGVVLGHIVAYLLGYPSAGPSHDHLVVTGHSWVGVATASLIAVIPVVLLSVAVRAVRTRASWSGSALVFRLVAIQVPAFVVIEAVERRGSVGRALADPAVFIGLVLQPLLAVLAAWLLELFGRAVLAVAARYAPPQDRAARSFPRPVTGVPRPRPRLAGPLGERAPPLPSIT